MKIKIGVDLLAISRIEKSLENGSDYLNYMYTTEEQNRSREHSQPVNYYASLFAIKEAAFKSMNIFWHPEMDWKDFIVHSVPYSHPTVSLSGKTKEIAEKEKIIDFSVSNSYDGDFVIATVLCMRK